MNFKTTLILLALVIVGGLLLWLGAPLPTWLGGTAPPAEVADAGTAQLLREKLTADELKRVEVQGAGLDRPVVLERGADGRWTAPGQWPTRQPEVEALVGLLSGLHTRFAPLPLGDDSELSEYGLDHPAVTVVVRAGPTEYHLDFGEKADAEGRLARPTYVRVDQKPEVIRLAPGLVAALSKPADYYLQRRLFPFERVARESGAQARSEQLAARSVAAEEAKPGGVKFTLTRAADWELSQPVKDRLDPDKRKAVLQALPDLWAEQFIAKPDKDLSKYGLDKPEMVLTVRATDDPKERPLVLLIGKESPTVRRRVTARPAPQLGMGRPDLVKQEVEEHFRYAKLQDNEQIFEVKSDKLKDIFVPSADLRDPRVARFEAKDVVRLELDRPGQPKIVLARDKEKNRWKLEQPTAGDAEGSKVQEVLDKLVLLQARDKDVLDKADPKVDGLDKPAAALTVTVEEEQKGEGESKPKQTRTLTLTVGRHDTAQKKLYVKDGWGRINAVEDSLAPLLERPATAYRGRRVLDVAAKDVEEIEVERQGLKLVALKQAMGNWKLTAPVAADADAAKTSQLVGGLAGLEAVEFVSNAAKPEELEGQYGLGQSALTVRLKLAGGKAETLLVGKQNGTKPEFYAKRASDPAVFVVKKELKDTLDQDSLVYRPLQLWQVLTADITALRVQKEGQPEYQLAKGDKDWKLSGPFAAAAAPAQVLPLTDALAGPRAERYVEHAAKDLAKYGLDKPYLRLTVSVKEGDKTKDRGLLVGKPADAPAGARYAKLADGEAVFVVADKVLAADKAALDLLDRQLVALPPDSIERVRSQNGSAAVALARKGADAWQVVEGPAAPFDADRDVADRAVRAWAGLQADRLAAYGPQADLTKFGLDKPEWVVTVKGQKRGADGKPGPAEEHTLELGKPVEGQAGARYARLDKGPAVAVLGAPAVADLTHTYLDFVERTLWKLDPATVAAVVRKAGDDSLELVKSDEVWKIIKPADQPADDKTMQELVGQLATLRAERVAAYPLKDAKPFGLDQPAAVLTVRLTGADGKPAEKVLKIGKPVHEQSPAGATPERFAQVEGSAVVAVLPGGLAQRLLAGPLAFRDRNLARFPDADKAVLERGPRKAVFTKVDGTWKLTEPLQAEAEQLELDDFVNLLARLRADELVAEKPSPDDLKRFGLDKPQAQWHFFSGDKEVLGLLLGEHPPLKGGGKDVRCYAKLAAGDLVFLLDAQAAGRALAEYRSRAVWSPPLDAVQVDTLRYVRGSSSFTLEKAGQGWTVAGKPELKVKADAVNDALAALAGLKVARYVVDKGADLKLYGLEPPELVIEATTRTGKRVLHVGRMEGDTKRYYVRVPDKDRTDVFVIAEGDAARIVRELSAFAGK